MIFKEVKSVRIKGKKYVFNIRVKDNRNYYANGILVHNCDDPNDAAEVYSKAKRDKVILWHDSKWSTRKNNEDSITLINQQRMHEEDLTGHVIKHDTVGNYTKLILPMEFENSRRCKTIPLSSLKGKIWEDPRKNEGDLLFPNFFTKERIETLKHELKTQYNISGQLQQKPTPEEGGIIKKKWFNWWKEEKYPRFLQIIQSWDTALTENKRNAYSACTTWGIFHNQYQVPNIMLLSVWRDHLAYPDLRKIAQKLALDYRDDGKNKDHVSSSQYKPSMILVEAKSSGISLIQDFHRAGIICVGFDPDKYGEKEARVNISSQIIEAGRVWLPAISPHFKQLQPFADMFLEECSLFPMTSSRDLVDTMTQVLLRLMNSQWLKNPKDYNDENESTYQPRTIY